MLADRAGGRGGVEARFVTAVPPASEGKGEQRTAGVHGHIRPAVHGIAHRAGTNVAPERPVPEELARSRIQFERQDRDASAALGGSLALVHVPAKCCSDVSRNERNLPRAGLASRITCFSKITCVPWLTTALLPILATSR